MKSGQVHCYCRWRSSPNFCAETGLGAAAAAAAAAAAVAVAVAAAEVS